MFNRKKNVHSFSHKIPLMFKLWAILVFSLVLLIWGTVGYGIYTVVTDPAVIGRIAGEVVSGFNEKVK